MLQNFKDARAAFDRIIEMKNKMRCVFQNHALRERGLKNDGFSASFAIAAAWPSFPQALTRRAPASVGRDINLVSVTTAFEFIAR